MIQNIDFLPATYHQSRQRKQKRIWRRGVLVLFLGLIGVGTLTQWKQHHRLIRTRDELQQQGRKMLQQLESPAAVQARIQHLETRADLVTALRLRVPPTRILASLTDCLPEFVSLTELRLQSDTRPQPRSAASAPPHPRAEKKEEQPDASPVEIDLKQLQEQQDRQARYVTLNGIAPDDLSISQFLANLQQSRTFDEVRLQYTNEHRHGEHLLRAFGMRLRVRSAHAPSYGLEEVAARPSS